MIPLNEMSIPKMYENIYVFMLARTKWSGHESKKTPGRLKEDKSYLKRNVCSGFLGYDRSITTCLLLQREHLSQGIVHLLSLD